MITAADYAEWIEVSGLYLRNVSPADQYRSLESQLSEAGVTVRILHDFLRDNPDFVHLRAWRRQYVFEMGEDREWRAERTARAIADIGATKTAAVMRTIQDDSLSRFWVEPGGAVWSSTNPPDPSIETRERIVELLDNYVRGQQPSLRQDMERHGDPRTAPGYTRQGREAELDRLREAYWIREEQVQRARDLTSALGNLKGALKQAAGALPARHGEALRKIREAIKEYTASERSALIPELQRWLEKASEFADRHPELFRPMVTSDQVLGNRLDALGTYVADVGKRELALTWDAPMGFDLDGVKLSMTLTATTGDPASLARALDRVDRLRSRWDEHREWIRLNLLECFANYEGQLDPSELRDYERDADGRITESAILSHAGRGSLSVDVTPNGEPPAELGIPVVFRADWDQEHAFEVWLDAKPMPDPGR